MMTLTHLLFVFYAPVGVSSFRPNLTAIVLFFPARREPVTSTRTLRLRVSLARAELSFRQTQLVLVCCTIAQPERLTVTIILQPRVQAVLLGCMSRPGPSDYVPRSFVPQVGLMWILILPPLASTALAPVSLFRLVLMGPVLLLSVQPVRLIMTTVQRQAV